MATGNSTLIKTLLAISGILSLPIQASAQGNFSPILPLSLGTAKEIPLLSETLRDPDFDGQTIYSDDEVGRRQEKIQSLLRDLEGAKDSAHAGFFEEIVGLYGSLADFYASDLAKSKDPAAAQEARAQAGIYAERWADASKSNHDQHSRAVYNLHVSRFLSGSAQSSAIKSLRKIVEDDGAPAKLRSRAKFLTTAWDIDHGDAASIARLRGFATSLSRTGAIAARLVLARAEAGISRSGAKVKAPSPSYRNLLIAANKQAKKLDSAAERKVLMFSLALWRLTEGASGSWQKPPFNLAASGESGERDAIIERQGLEYFAKGDTARTLRIYRSLAEKYSSDKRVTDFDRRILDVEASGYKKTGKYKSYETAIGVVLTKYGSDQSALAEARSMLSATKARYMSLVRDELAAASLTNTTKAKRIAAIHLADRYLARIDTPSEKEFFKAAIGRLWALNSNHRRAVEVYIELAEEIAPGKKFEYLNLAINSQRVLAQWPANAPWQPIARTRTEPRQTLLKFYERISELRKGSDWTILAQVGQLKIHLGEKQAAFALWMAALAGNSAGPEAAHAAGFMMLDHLSSKNWQALEDLARLCRGAKMTPTTPKGPLNPADLLAIALLEGGKDALAASNFALATRKLGEFVEKFQARNRDEGMFYLGSAYHGNNEDIKAIKTLISFSEEYTTSRFYKQAMLNGGDWAVPMAFEENAIYFFVKFLRGFPRDTEAARVRDSLSDLYIGRQLYAEAAAVLNQQLTAANISQDDKEKAAIQLMRVEAKNGTSNKGATAAAQVLTYAKDPGIRAEAISVRSRAYAAAGDLAALKKSELDLHAIAGEEGTQEVLGEIRFYIATAQLRPILEPINPLTLADPRQTIIDKYRDFTFIKKSYQAVCDAGATSYCVPALHRTARIAERLISLLEDVQIPETLAKSVVEAFSQEKIRTLDALTKESLASDEKALAIAGRGYTHPEWIQQVYWQNASDMNFAPVSGEAGRAYVQWPITDNK